MYFYSRHSQVPAESFVEIFFPFVFELLYATDFLIYGFLYTWLKNIYQGRWGRKK